MKYKLKEYAKALSESMVSKKLSDKELVNNFIELLRKNREFKNARKILELAQKYYLTAGGGKKITLEMARPLDKKDILRNIKKEGDIVEERTNLDLIAGIIIIIDENRQLDFSLKNRLNKVFSA